MRIRLAFALGLLLASVFLGIRPQAESGAGRADRFCTQTATIEAAAGPLWLELPREARFVHIELSGRDDAGASRPYQIAVPGHVPGIGQFADVVPSWSARVKQFGGSIEAQPGVTAWTLLNTYSIAETESCVASLSIPVQPRGESAPYVLGVPKGAEIETVSIWYRAEDESVELLCHEASALPASGRVACARASRSDVEVSVTPRRDAVGPGFRLRGVNAGSTAATVRVAARFRPVA